MRKLLSPASTHCFSSAVFLAEANISAREPTLSALVALPFVTPLFGIRLKADISFLGTHQMWHQ